MHCAVKILIGRIIMMMMITTTTTINNIDVHVKI